MTPGWGTRSGVLAVWVTGWIALGFPVSADTSPGLIDESPEASTSETADADAADSWPDPLAAGWRGEEVCELLQEGPQGRLLRCAFPPGVGHEPHVHAPHLGFTLAGSHMRITDDEGVREVEIPTGTSWSSQGGRWHEVVNVGNTTGLYLIFEPPSPPEPRIGDPQP